MILKSKPIRSAFDIQVARVAHSSCIEEPDVAQKFQRARPRLLAIASC
jgi:hypothetical protein